MHNGHKMFSCRNTLVARGRRRERERDGSVILLWMKEDGDDDEGLYMKSV